MKYIIEIIVNIPKTIRANYKFENPNILILYILIILYILYNNIKNYRNKKAIVFYNGF